MGNSWSTGAGVSEVNGKLGFVRMDNGAAVAPADFGEGRSGVLTALARRIEDFELRLRRTFPALRAADENSCVADALFRYTIQFSGCDPHRDRLLRQKFCDNARE